MSGSDWLLLGGAGLVVWYFFFQPPTTPSGLQGVPIDPVTGLPQAGPSAPIVRDHRSGTPQTGLPSSPEAHPPMTGGIVRDQRNAKRTAMPTKRYFATNIGAIGG